MRILRCVQDRLLLVPLQQMRVRRVGCRDAPLQGEFSAGMHRDAPLLLSLAQCNGRELLADKMIYHAQQPGRCRAGVRRAGGGLRRAGRPRAEEQPRGEPRMQRGSSGWHLPAAPALAAAPSKSKIRLHAPGRPGMVTSPCGRLPSAQVYREQREHKQGGRFTSPNVKLRPIQQRSARPREAVGALPPQKPQPRRWPRSLGHSPHLLFTLDCCSVGRARAGARVRWAVQDREQRRRSRPRQPSPQA